MSYKKFLFLLDREIVSVCEKVKIRKSNRNGQSYVFFGGPEMEVPLCQIDITQDGQIIIAKVKSDLGDRKFTSHSLGGVLEQLFTELEEEFDALV